MYQNATRLQATGEFRLLKPPDILQCVTIDEIAGNGGKFPSLKPPVLLPGQRKVKLLKPTVAASYFAMYQNTTRLQATGGI